MQPISSKPLENLISYLSNNYGGILTEIFLPKAKHDPVENSITFFMILTGLMGVTQDDTLLGLCRTFAESLLQLPEGHCHEAHLIVGQTEADLVPDNEIVMQFMNPLFDER